jgi:hypothetical protein
MAGSIKPILKGVYVCDDVVGNPSGGKPMIVNLWNTWRAGPDDQFPVRVKKLCVFAWLRGGRGTLPFRVEIVHSRTSQMIGQSHVFTIDLTAPNRSVYAKFLITNFSFQEPGDYLVELFCADEFLDDQPIRIMAHSEDSHAES